VEKGNEFWFVRVPAADPFRHSVRAFRATGPALIRVRYYDAETNEFLAERSDETYGSSAWHCQKSRNFPPSDHVKIPPLGRDFVLGFRSWLLICLFRR
jgi:hypothetical protein